MKQPMQPLVVDASNVVRFHANKIVRFILDNGGIDLNKLACLPFSDEDRTQFAQLIGYSLCGFHELSYVSDEDAIAASKLAQAIMPGAGGCRDDGCEIHSKGR